MVPYSAVPASAASCGQDCNGVYNGKSSLPSCGAIITATPHVARPCSCRWDVTVDDVAQLILPHAGDDDWTRWDGRWAPWRPGHARPPAPPSANVTEFGAYGRDVEIQVRWLKPSRNSPHGCA